MREDRCHAQVNAEMRMLSHHTPCRPDLHRTPLAVVVRLSTRWGVRLDSGAQGDPVCGRPPAGDEVFAWIAYEPRAGFGPPRRPSSHAPHSS